MPIYPFRCEECSGEFDVFASYEKATSEKWPCEHCGSTDTKKVPALLTYHMGLTAAEKSAGVKKSRRDAGNYMRDARDKRKKNLVLIQEKGNQMNFGLAENTINKCSRVHLRSKNRFLLFRS